MSHFCKIRATTGFLRELCLLGHISKIKCSATLLSTAWTGCVQVMCVVQEKGAWSKGLAASHSHGFEPVFGGPLPSRACAFL